MVLPLSEGTKRVATSFKLAWGGVQHKIFNPHEREKGGNKVFFYVRVLVLKDKCNTKNKITLFFVTSIEYSVKCLFFATLPFEENGERGEGGVHAS